MASSSEASLAHFLESMDPREAEAMHASLQSIPAEHRQEYLMEVYKQQMQEQVHM